MEKKEKKQNISRREKWILSFVTWMDLESIMLSEINHTEKDKYDFTYMGI